MTTKNQTKTHGAEQPKSIEAYLVLSVKDLRGMYEAAKSQSEKFCGGSDLHCVVFRNIEISKDSCGEYQIDALDISHNAGITKTADQLEQELQEQIAWGERDFMNQTGNFREYTDGDKTEYFSELERDDIRGQIERPHM